LESFGNSTPQLFTNLEIEEITIFGIKGEYSITIPAGIVVMSVILTDNKQIHIRHLKSGIYAYSWKMEWLNPL
jgi:hypothetical protein